MKNEGNICHIVHEVGIKLVEQNWEHVIYQKRADFNLSKDSKVSSLTCKCVFYRPKHNAEG